MIQPSSTPERTLTKSGAAGAAALKRYWAGVRERGCREDQHRCNRKMRDGTRCKRARMRHSTLCPIHGGASQKNRYLRKLAAGGEVVECLPMFYKRVMGKTLSRFVEECLESPPHEQLSLYEELALTRHQAAQVIALYSAVVEMPDGPKKDEAMKMAADLQQQALERVAKMAQSAASIEAASKDRISIHHIAFVINQVCRISHTVLGDTPELARKFERAIREEIKLPQTGQSEGTMITPDQDVLEMDHSIPLGPIT